jgi:hypothetical protein
VEACGLQPYTTYYYQFSVCGTDLSSPVGRTKTAPDENDADTPVSMAVFSCSNYPNGYFNAYGNAARKDEVDYFIHLGDYVYEYQQGVLGRDPRAVYPEREIVTLYDYRTRIAQYRTDEDLSLAHQNFPWIPVWDDHEVANNGYRDGFSGMNNTEESFLEFGRVSVDQRKMNAVRAYFEYQPIRQVAMDDNLRIWRNFKLGKMVDLIMLDTRNYDRSITTLEGNDGKCRSGVNHLPSPLYYPRGCRISSVSEHYCSKARPTGPWVALQAYSFITFQIADIIARLHLRSQQRRWTKSHGRSTGELVLPESNRKQDQGCHLENHWKSDCFLENQHNFSKCFPQPLHFLTITYVSPFLVPTFSICVVAPDPHFLSFGPGLEVLPFITFHDTNTTDSGLEPVSTAFA